MIKSVLPLSLIIALRFFGLFLVLPVISVYAINLEGATPTLVGIVIGGYALTQMLFQIPFGVISDKFSRKGTIVFGLVIFAIGSLICAVSTDIYTLIFGRFLQGAGSIGAVVTAMISDLVKEEQRPKAMALMGSSIALAFAISMIAGPTMGAAFGVETLFYITLALALLSIFVLIKKVPNPPHITHTYNKKADLGEILGNPNLIKMNITNFLQKGLMTFAFMIIPITLINNFKWEMNDLWQVYLPAMILGILAMGPAAVLAEKKGKFKEILFIGIVFFTISYLVIGFSPNATIFIIGVVIFFVGFNMHEPIMQSLATKFAKVHQRGLVLGIFTSAGYIGTFLGGIIGGLVYQNSSMETLSIVIAIVCVLWAILIFKMPNPAKKKFVYLSLNEYHLENSSRLNHDAIDEWYINNTENIIAIKYDNQKINEEEIKNLLK
ncbi:MFS transporter [Arcobacter cloacae]|uniref:MFS transporter n=1 Tax=Arcobacter cloacae TaxID=1054034 RepID=A0A6M8NRW7_9BACT|nr:MFS transporter [Arcobacter cloacae]QKF89236.1 putative sugar transporter, major facilitator superfamily [Arcobacter cloacae]RXI42591.1 MFS transporter [Arcobacter cloacae]